MGSHKSLKVLSCLATGRVERGTWDQVIFVQGRGVGWVFGVFFNAGVVGCQSQTKKPLTFLQPAHP